MRVDNSERIISRIIVGDQAARFERHGHLPLEAQFLLDDDISFRESLRRIAALESEIKREVVTQLGMDDRCIRRSRLQLIADRMQSFPLENDKLGRIFGLRAGRRPRLSRPAVPAKVPVRPLKEVAAPNDDPADLTPRPRVAHSAD